ncbi:unnamed protein product [Cylicocyclus nassatus]|uniref:beta-N-acetylhexosaminidase n=1 Tax=Cylicocyclus nassatus TaxID=53992 RepID=A0AA36GI22_CYLNA|nr:unnamed protein product [Cylicocyclus nassatus]
MYLSLACCMVGLFCIAFVSESVKYNGDLKRIKQERVKLAEHSTKIFKRIRTKKNHMHMNKQGHGRNEKFYKNTIVHFDLKGAPPKVEYFLDLLQLVAKSGATGILIEWEDMFPWLGVLRTTRNTEAYTEKEVEKILAKARSLDLDVIPLVQTFGHMEWMLKYEEFRRFRENDEYPQVICIGDQNAVNLVKEAIRQVATVHNKFGLKYFHIGADEAFEYGTCKATAALQKSMRSLDRVAIKHMATIAAYAKEITKGATILAWHDMLKNFEQREVVKMGLDTLVQPVIWDYTETLATVDPLQYEAIVNTYGKIWMSSAFKGADSPTSKYNRLKHYMENNVAWILEERKYRRIYPSRHTQGIIITGWSRYDHMAGLCETWPVSEPSMVTNVQIALIGAQSAYEELDRADILQKANANARQIMDCSLHDGLERCKFPGQQLYKAFQVYYKERLDWIKNDLADNYQIKGWLSPYNMRHNMTQNWYLRLIESTVTSYLQELNIITRDLKAEMNKLFSNNTVEEFFFANVDPDLEKLHRYRDEIKRLRNFRVYGRRSFPIRRDYQGL